jgi:RNA polymerase sigma-70 factor (ECF subfamily)
MTAVEFNSQYDQLEDLLFAFAMKLTRNYDNAKDLMQETVANAYANRDRFKMGTNFKAWMTTIMRNAFINNYRKVRKRNQIEQPIEDVAFAVESKTVNQKADSVIMMKELKKMLSSLKDDHRIPFWMYYQGYQYNEIAGHLDLPIGTVKSRIFFARKKLKKKINDHYEVKRA